LTRLYANEDFTLRVVEELRRLGHNVLTAFEDDRADQAISRQRKKSSRGEGMPNTTVFYKQGKSIPASILERKSMG
jgi:hypothetical protein